MKNIFFSKKTLRAAAAPVIVFVLIAALVTATVFIADKGDIGIKGVIGRGANGEASGIISDEPFRYDVATRTAFIFDFEKFIAVIFSKTLLDAIGSAGVSVSQQWGTAVIDAFRRARVPGEKLLAFGDYLEKSAHDIGQSFDDPEKACVIIALYALLQDDADGEILSALFGGIDWQAFYKEIIRETGLNPDEAGRVLYQFALAPASEEDKQLIVELGERRFGVLFARTVVATEEISMLTSGSSLASARMVAELLYALGSEYREIIDTFGIENLNKLFGSISLDGVLLDTDYSGHVLSAVEASAELFGFGVSFLSETLTALDNNIAYSYHAHLQGEGAQKDKSLAESVLYLSAAVQKGLAYAYGVTKFNMLTLGGKIAEINARLRLVSDPEADYNDALVEEAAKLTAVYQALANLADAEEQAREAGYGVYLSDAAKVEQILDYAETISAYAPEIERGAKMASSLIVFSYLSNIISPDT